ncbi:unnamed protein product [Peniophora sp. CBMAI 1063]|nr:unnamed protein product [Peniophora sp. CBMAI 1063]
MCRVKDADLSYDSLTSRVTRSELLSLRSSDPALYSELTGTTSANETPSDSKTYTEDEEVDSEFEDDSDIPISAVVKAISGSSEPINGVQSNEDGSLSCNTLSESLDDEDGEEASASAGAFPSSEASTSTSTHTRPVRMGTQKQAGFYAMEQFSWRK